MSQKHFKILKTDIIETPNALTVKTIKAVHNGKGVDKPIKSLRAFINSL